VFVNQGLLAIVFFEVTALIVLLALFLLLRRIGCGPGLVFHCELQSNA